MNSFCRAFVPCALVLFLALSGVCIAADQTQTGLYAEGGVGLYALKLPGYAPLVAFDNVNITGGVARVTLHDDMAVGPIGRLTLGWRTASPLFFELSGRFFETTDHRSSEHTGAQYGATFVGFFSPSSANNAHGTGGTAFTDLRSLFHESGGRLLAGYALDLGGDVTLTPLLGFELMRIDQKYDMDYHSSTGDVMDLHEDVGAVYQGAVAGLRIEAELGRWLGTLEGFVAGYRVETGYEGRMNATDYVDKHSLQATDSATGLEIGAALDRRLGPWSVGVRGAYRHLSHVPEIIAGTASPAIPLSVFERRPTYLSGYESRAYTLELRVRCSF